MTETPPGAIATAEVLARTAKIMMDRRRPDLAGVIANLALAEDADCANAHSVLAVVHEETGEWQAGLEHAGRAADLLPASPQFRYNLALALLRLDDYRAGFSLIEARIDKPDWTGLAIAPSRTAERARLLHPGDPVDGRCILVITEQGLGDSIMFARYLPLLAGRGARVTLVCSPSLRPIFERVDGITTLLSPPPEEPLAKINLSAALFDAWVPLLSLPLHFGTEFTTVPAEVPYVAIDPLRRKAWRARYAAAGRAGMRKVGLVFHANPLSASAPDRSIPLGDLAPLLRLPGIDWINLQGGAAGRALASTYPALTDATAMGVLLDEFAAAVAATDLLITADTMAAHCAGALGHPVWIMVPYSPHWCWGNGRKQTPWYPSARMFRQERRGDWPSTVAAIARALGRWSE